MIPVQPGGFVAVFKVDERIADRIIKGRTVERPVVAWSDAGEPLVLWHDQLVDATMLPGFERVEERDRVIGVLPGGGVTLRIRSGDWEGWLPTLGWLVYEDGACRALVPTDPGYAGPLESGEHAVEWLHPDATESPDAAA